MALAHLCRCLERAPCALRTLGPPGSCSRKRPGPAGARDSAGSGLGWPGALPEAPIGPPYCRGLRVPVAVRPDAPAGLCSAQLRSGGVPWAAARTLWQLRLQRAAPGSARAGGGCYARNVRVSGSPSGSKRPTNNLAARRPPPPSASSRSLLPAPAVLRGGGAADQAGPSSVPRLSWALQDRLHPSPSRSPPGPSLPAPLYLRSCWGRIQLGPIPSPTPSPPFSHPFIPRVDDTEGCTSRVPESSGYRCGKSLGKFVCLVCVRACVFTGEREDCKVVHICRNWNVLPAK